MDRRPSRRPRSGRCLAVLLAGVLTLAPPQALAQIDNLPRLGDATSDELSPLAERRLGDSIMRQVRRDAAWLDDAELVDYLNRFAAPLAATPAAGGLDFEFFAIADPSINAFALPGGFIGVHAGLLMAAESESELAAVLAHEIGHVTQRHIARMLAQQKTASLVSLGAFLLAILAARSNPQAAFGGAMLGEQVARQGMLSFSREAEREADRVGFEILRQAGFDTQGIVAFFIRLQTANRVYDSNAPTYMRTHPLTAERIADMQLRIRDSRYRQRPDSLSFELLRARLRATADPGAEARIASRARFEQQVRDSPKASPAPWFGLAAVAAAQRDWARVDSALAQAEAVAGAPHPYFDRLAASARIAADDAAGAVARARAGLQRTPDSRALARVLGEALLAAGQPREAIRVLDDQLLTWRGDARLWQLLSQAHAALGQRTLAHRAAAEQYAALGSPLTAREQLLLARKAADADFYTASVIDARIRDIEADALRELEETRQLAQQQR
jgi:predicted Zn-dependent protease